MADPEYDISVLIPVHNEMGNVLPVLEEVMTALEGLSFQVIAIDDGSTDETPKELASALARWPEKLAVRTHVSRAGKSAALMTGLSHARGEWVQLLDGDGQNDPRDTRRIWDAHFAEGNQTKTTIGQAPVRLGLITGRRLSHNNGLARWLLSMISNGIGRLVLDDNTRDPASGWKLIRAETFHQLPYFAAMHLYFPALVKRAGWSVLEEAVTDRPRLGGKSKHRVLGRMFAGVFDLMGMIWLVKRGRPGLDKAWLEKQGKPDQA